jgi:hypothetical protein
MGIGPTPSGFLREHSIVVTSFPVRLSALKYYVPTDLWIIQGCLMGRGSSSTWGAVACLMNKLKSDFPESRGPASPLLGALGTTQELVGILL